MRAPTIALALATAAASAGCGLGVIDTNADGTAGLPTAGAGPYGRLAGDDLTPALEPQLIGERNFQLSDPTALRDDDRLRIWFARAPDTGRASRPRSRTRGARGRAQFPYAAAADHLPRRFARLGPPPRDRRRLAGEPGDHRFRRDRVR